MAQLSKYCDCAKSTMAERSSAILDEAAASLDYTLKDEQKKALQCVCQWKRCVRVRISSNGIWKVAVLRSTSICVWFPLARVDAIRQ